MYEIWREKQHIAGDARALAQQLDVLPITAQLLLDRGVTADNARAFLHPEESEPFPPEAMQDMTVAVARIRRALANSERICVYGDYDADGLTAAAILLEALEILGGDVFCHIPNRLEEGYGLSVSALEEICEQSAGLIITVDCGVTAFDECEWALAAGMDMIVTDHHTRREGVPVCCACLHPDFSPCHYLTGAGVAYKLAQALLGSRMPPRLLQWAAIGTVADVAVLRDENRNLVRRALISMNSEPDISVESLLRAAGAWGKKVTASTLGFVIGPRLNACGRMGDPMRAMHMLRVRDADQSMAWATELNRVNAERQLAEQEIMRSAEEMIRQQCDLANDRVIVLCDPGWSHGIVGIAAARIASRYYKPTVILGDSDGACTGSGRSIPGVNLYEGIHAAADLCLRYGGHAYAAGLTVKKEDIPQLRDRMNAWFGALPDELFIPSVEYDAVLDGADLRLAEELESMEPFDNATNPRPLFMLRGPVESARRVGADKNTLRLQVRGITGVGFRMGEWADGWRGERCYEMLTRVSVNEYLGMRSAQWQLESVRTAAECGKEIIADSETALAKCYVRCLANANAPLAVNAQWDEVLRLLKRKPCGVLLAAATPEDAGFVWQLLMDSSLCDRVCVAVGTPPTGYPAHCLLLAPDGKDSCEGYAHRYDVGMDLGTVGASRLPGGADVPKLTRDDVAAVYRMVRSLPQPAAVKTVFSALEGRLDVRSVLLSVEVLRDMELICGKDAISLCQKQGKHDIMESITMKRIYRKG